MSEQPVLPIHSKICFLLCDPTKAEFIDSYGDFTNLFTALYTKLLLRLAGERLTSFLPDVMKSFRLQPFKVFEGIFPDLATIDQYDSVIVSGSSTFFLLSLIRIDAHLSMIDYGVNDGDEWIKDLGKLLHTIATQHPKIKLIGHYHYFFFEIAFIYEVILQVYVSGTRLSAIRSSVRQSNRIPNGKSDHTK